LVLEHLYFCFQFYFVLFAAINGWTPTNFFWRRCTCFSLPRTLLFSLLSFNECSLFLELRLAFIFCLDFWSDLVLSLHQGVFRPLVYVGFHQKSCLKKVWMVLEKRKSFMQKSGTKRSLFRLLMQHSVDGFSPSSWELQEDGMMSTAANFPSIRNQGLSVQAKAKLQKVLLASLVTLQQGRR
jgi:hypothetical protein